MTLEDIHIPKGWELQELQNVTTLIMNNIRYI